MDASFAALYLSPVATVHLRDLRTLGDGCGFVLHHPLRGEISCIDEAGDASSVDDEYVSSRLSGREDLSVLFWEREWEGPFPADLYCRVRFTPLATIVEFGMLPEEVGPFVRTLWAAYWEQAEGHGAIGLVVDVSGVTEDLINWDDFFLKEDQYDGPCPDLLVFDMTRGRTMPADCESAQRATIGSHAVACHSALSHIINLSTNPHPDAPRAKAGGGEDE